MTNIAGGTGKYEVVDDAADDVKLPLHNDDIFQHGITFPVKVYIFGPSASFCNYFLPGTPDYIQ